MLVELRCLRPHRTVQTHSRAYPYRGGPPTRARLRPWPGLPGWAFQRPCRRSGSPGPARPLGSRARGCSERRVGRHLRDRLIRGDGRLSRSADPGIAAPAFHLPDVGRGGRRPLHDVPPRQDLAGHRPGGDPGPSRRAGSVGREPGPHRRPWVAALRVDPATLGRLGGALRTFSPASSAPAARLSQPSIRSSVESGGRQGEAPKMSSIDAMPPSTTVKCSAVRWSPAGSLYAAGEGESPRLRRTRQPSQNAVAEAPPSPLPSGGNSAEARWIVPYRMAIGPGWIVVSG
jgi:hypothetical protein